MMGVMIGRDASGNIRLTFPYDPVYVARVTFRHCFATHLLEANYDRERAPYRGAHRDMCSFLSGKPRSLGLHIRTVQELLGHKDVSTTMIYTHVLNRPGISVKSPLDG